MLAYRAWVGVGVTGTWKDFIAYSLIFKKISYLMSIYIEDTTHIEDLLVGECSFWDLEELPDNSQHCCHVSVVPKSKTG